ncbi:MAG: hypothetical protein K2Y18_06280 [Alphaproteobacteria bacterium]|jgi:hypothetical protein|nr:hypothetical protein [Alphaproteobacteria bacterium]
MNEQNPDNKPEYINLLLRKNRGKTDLEKIHKRLIEATSIPELYFTSLEQRDILNEKFFMLFKNEKARHVFKLENQDSNLILKKIFKQLTISPQQFGGNLCFSHYENIGLLQINTPLFFENAPVLLEIDGNSLFIIDEDLKNGIMVDYYESDNGPGWTYELIILGQKWSEAFYALLSSLIKESISPENSTLH